MSADVGPPPVPAFGQATLEDCDREPIHIPGSIQPQGCLLALDPKSRTIAQTAGEFERILGIEPDDWIGARLDEVLPRELASGLSTANLPIRMRPVPLKSYDVELLSPAGRVDATIHEHDGMTIFEFEPAVRSNVDGASGPLAQVQRMISTLERIQSVDEFCQKSAALVRAITGFGRVKIYRFLSDGSGRVVAEDREAAMESYLGLHFPETDIPKQARELYLSNWLRLIGDVNYRPQPVAPEINPITRRPLDLSFATFRSVSPLHIEYLQNMGVGASMSISIVIRGQLWGLIACHHYAPLLLPCNIRAACELFGQVFSLQLESRLHAEQYEYRLEQKSIQHQLTRQVEDGADLAERLVGRDPDLLHYVGADGVAVMLGGGIAKRGRTPTEPQIRAIAEALDTLGDEVFATRRLSELLPAAAEHAVEASGLLALPLSSAGGEYVLWFRSEVVETVKWAGSPAKAVTPSADGNRLTPRSSFAAWRETVRETSRPWKEVEIEAAEALRPTLLQVVLRRVEEARREQVRTDQRQALLLGELDHRVKNIMAHIKSLIRFSRTSADDVESYVQNLERRLTAMTHAHSLLSQSRWHGAGLRSVIEEELAPFKTEGGASILIEGEEVTLQPQAALSFSLVVHELATNAAKYGALSVYGGRVEIRWRREQENGAAKLLLSWRESGGPRVEPPTRTGFGRRLVERSLQHELGGQAELRFEPGGVEYDLAVPWESLARDDGGMLPGSGATAGHGPGDGAEGPRTN